MRTIRIWYSYSSMIYLFCIKLRIKIIVYWIFLYIQNQFQLLESFFLLIFILVTPSLKIQ